MTDVLKLGKKAFTFAVVLTTILWSVGVAAIVPLVANAADVTLTVGDVIKGVSTKNVFYYSSDGKRYTFPSDKVFFTWFKDWSVVKTISDAQMGGITIGGTLPYRAGTQLIKIQTDPKVYAVEPAGTIRWVETEAIAISLFGSAWAKKVHDVDPSIFPYVYKVGSSVNTATYPAGALVKSGADTYYIVDATHKQKVTADGMTANRFFSANVVTTSLDLSGYASGSDIMSAQTSLTTVVGTGSVVPDSTGSGITVALATDQPVAATIVSDSANGAQAMIDVLKLVFTAPADGDVVVKSVVLKRGGISADTEISNMYFYDGATQVAGNPSVATSMVTFTNSSGMFTVAKGTSKIIAVKLDLKNNTAAGKTISFGLNAASDVTLASGSVSGTFPMTGNTFTTALVADLGKLVFSNLSTAASYTVDPGQTAYEIWKFQVADTAQNIEIRKLNITLVGSINVGDLKNFTLWSGATQIGSTVAEMNASKVVSFDLTSAPYVISTGVTKQLVLKSDIVAGTNRNFYASFQNGSDIVTYDKGYNVYLKSNATDSFTIVKATGATTINVGTLTQTLAVDAPTGNIADAATTVTLAKFNWKANGEDIKVSSLSVSSTGSDITDALVNVKLLVNGSQVGTTDATLTADGSASTDWGSFGNNFIIKAGTTAVVTIVADLTSGTVAASATFVVGTELGVDNAQGTVSLTAIDTLAQNSNTLTVKAGTVTVAKNTAFGNKSDTNPTGTLNASGAKLASFVITAGAGESVDLTQIAIKDDGATECIGDYVQNLTLKNAAGTQLAPSYANPTSGDCTTANSYTFNLNPSVTLAAGAQYVVDIYGDLKASLATATSLFELDVVTANGHDTGTAASNAAANLSLQNVYISGSGAFLIATDADTPVANNYLMGATDQTIAKYKITASSTEAVNVTQLVVSGKFSTGATGTWQNIKLYDNDSGAQIGTAVASFSDTAGGLVAASSTYSHAVFSGLSLNVPKGSSKVIVVKADASTYEGLGVSTTGQTVAPVVMRALTAVTGGTNPVTATGASSGSSLTAGISQTNSAWGVVSSTVANHTPGAYGTTSTLYRAKLTTAWASDTPSGSASGGAAQTVAKFVITNLANSGAYTVTVNYVNFDISTSISQAQGTALTTRALTVYKDSLSTTAVGTTNYAVGRIQFPNSAFTSWTNTVDISSGASKTFYATLDTTDALSTKTLSIRIGSDDVNWTDGVSSGLAVMGTDLPLVYKTFTY